MPFSLILSYFFFPSGLTSTFPCKVKPSGDRNRPQVSYVPWTKAELQAIAKEFPKVTQDPQKFAEEFDITIIQAYQSGFSDLFMLVGEGQAPHWMRIAR